VTHAVPVLFLLLAFALPVPRQHAVSVHDLLDQFRATTVFWQQLVIAKEIVRAGDVGVLKELESSLNLDDRHLRGNAAFIFASLGDERGFETIRGMLTDRSYRELGQGIPGVAGDMSAPSWWLNAQIESDRYYAVHLLGELKSGRAADLLLTLLTDDDLNYKAAWALGQIGDTRAIRALIAALDHRDALMRVSAIRALVTLQAREALPRLRQMLSDAALPKAGDRVPVGETARAAIEALERQR
jgi:HEAT repeat protein